ncbi:MAG TPA: LysR family transcriptional regulator [Candidatus Acidoferrum sp.]|nr:LysR family transcriptional regulator [Candidatus Acidoferrum sp.]
MDLPELEMFVAVVEERSVGRAAARLFRTQPAVSIALGKLEKQIGTTLLDRSSRLAFRLTPAGALLYEKATQMIAIRNEVVVRFRGQGPGGSQSRLLLGTAETGSRELVARMAEQFKLGHPAVHIELSSSDPERLLREVADRGIDAAFFGATTHPVKTLRGITFRLLQGAGTDKPLTVALPERGCSYTLKRFVDSFAAQDSPSFETPLRSARRSVRTRLASTAALRRDA